MFGLPSLTQNNDRKIAAAVKRAMDEMQESGGRRLAVFEGGMPDVTQNGDYDENGQWENFLTCGDPLDSGGCGP